MLVNILTTAAPPKGPGGLEIPSLRAPICKPPSATTCSAGDTATLLSCVGDG